MSLGGQIFVKNCNILQIPLEAVINVEASRNVKIVDGEGSSVGGTSKGPQSNRAIK